MAQWPARETKRLLREVQREAGREYNEERDFDDPLEGNHGFLVVRASENATKSDQKRAKKKEKSRKGTKNKQVRRKVCSKTWPEPQRAPQRGPTGAQHVLSML